jgi:hypothetical protein
MLKRDLKMNPCVAVIVAMHAKLIAEWKEDRAKCSQLYVQIAESRHKFRFNQRPTVRCIAVNVINITVRPETKITTESTELIKSKSGEFLKIKQETSRFIYRAKFCNIKKQYKIQKIIHM